MLVKMSTNETKEKELNINLEMSFFELMLVSLSGRQKKNYNNIIL